jgi:hypothetical protein
VNGKMKNKVIQKFSPLALGIIICSYQLAQVPFAYGASLKTAATDDSLLTPDVSGLQSTPSTAAAGCPLSPTGGGSALPNSSPPALSSSALGSGGDLAPSTGVLASSVTGSVVPSSVVANAPASNPAAPSNFSSNLVAQAPALDDCCEIGGTSTCEVAGVAPPVGGGALGGFPLAALAGLAVPLVAIPLIAGGGGGGNGTPPPPVPEPSSTAAITAGLGLLGLWYGRRFRASHKPSA